MVKTRIAPSPTGQLHIGTVRTALINYLYARQAHGEFVIRIEDTDKIRSKAEYEMEILNGFTWLGLESDDIVRQSGRIQRHTELLTELIKKGTAYVSKEESRNEAGKTVEVVRLKNPGQVVTFHDEVRGDISFDTTELGDFVIARSLTDPLYHFAVVVDDMDMEITHVIRGEDHISNTPRQILIQEAINAPRPVYAHLPLILDSKRAKLSKRDTVTSIIDYKNEGILPEALINYIALLGWNPGDDREDFSLTELVKNFSLKGIQKGGGAWDRDKLLSVNQRWMRKLTDEAYIAQMHDINEFDHILLRRIVPLLKERSKSFKEAHMMLRGELHGLFEAPKIDREKLLSKEPGDRPETARIGLESLLKLVENFPEEFPPMDRIKEILMPVADNEEKRGKGGRGAILWPLRYALSGEERSPDPFTLISILGVKESILRIRLAIDILK